MRKHAPYKRLEGFKKEHAITNSMIADALGLSETCVIQKNTGISDYYVSEVLLLRNKLGIPTECFF